MNRFDQFIRERQYLMNVSPATISWYTHAFKWMPSESPTEPELKAMVMRMRERGLKPTGCNAAIRAINAYLRWNGSLLKISQLKEPQLSLPTFTDAQVKLLLAWKPSGFYERRLHLLVLFLLDTGCRITEALGLLWSDVDYNNLLLTLHGKGSKDRMLPLGIELRRSLFKWQNAQQTWVFCNRDGRKLGRCVMLRNVKKLCHRLGFDAPKRTLHAFRHTFALNYIRRGGSVFHLQKALGHSSLEMSRRYANLQTDDLQRTHERVSMLNAK
jgi:integrase/recombinase XerD